MRDYKLIPIYLLLLSSILLNFVKADNSMLTKKPYFTLRIETKGTLYEAKMNGVVVFDDSSNGYSLIAEKPVNYYMKTGSNIIGLNLFPKHDSKFSAANITLSLYVNQDEAPESEKRLLSSITFNGKDYDKGTSIQLSRPEVRLDSRNKFRESEQGDAYLYSAKIKPATVQPGALSVSQEIKLQTPFPRWGYLDGDDIDFPLSYNEYLQDQKKWDTKTVTPLYKEYENIYNLLKANKLDEVVDLFKERNKEYGIAMYYPTGTYDKKLKKSLEKDAQNLQIKLRPTNFSTPYISDDKKLLKLGDDSMIYFVNDDETSFTKYEIIFYKKGDKWIISR